MKSKISRGYTGKFQGKPDFSWPALLASISVLVAACVVIVGAGWPVILHQWDVIVGYWFGGGR